MECDFGLAHLGIISQVRNGVGKKILVLLDLAPSHQQDVLWKIWQNIIGDDYAAIKVQETKTSHHFSLARKRGRS
jgi:hypothetical protein